MRVRNGTFNSILLLLLFSFSNARPQGTEQELVLDLKAALNIALEQSPQMRIAGATERISNAEVTEARAFTLPQLSVQSSYSRNIKKPAFFAKFGDQTQKIVIGSNNAVNSSLNLNQVILQNGQLGLGKALEIAELAGEIASETKQRTRNEVIFNVRRAFYTVLLSREVVSVFEESLQQAEAHHHNLQLQFDQGLASEFDLLRSEVQVAEVRPALIQAQNNYELSLKMLKTAIGLPLDRKIQIEGALEFVPHPGNDIDKTIKQGLAQRPEMRQLELQERIARLNLSIQKWRWLPSLSFNANYLFQGQSDDFSFDPLERNTSLAATLNLQFNIFDGFETRAKIRKARAELDRILSQKQQLTQAIEIEIAQAIQKMKEAQERIDAQKKSVRQAEKAYQIAGVRYEQGIGTQLELFDARLALNRIKTNYLQAIYDYNIALFSWQKAIGKIN